MAEGSSTIAANCNNENRNGSCETHHVSSSPQEHSSVSKGALGKGESGATEEGDVEPKDHYALSPPNRYWSTARSRLLAVFGTTIRARAKRAPLAHGRTKHPM